MSVKVVVGPNGHLPFKAHVHDAGFDLRASEHVTLGGFHDYQKLVSTDVKIAIPEGYVGLVCPRSGLASKHEVTVLNAPGIIDSGYTGEIKVNLINNSTEEFFIEPGDKIAQLVIVPLASVNQLSEVESLEETERGEGGHGSTGRN